MAARFSIRYKFLFVTTLLLVACVGAYLLLATRVFKTDKTELVFDYNRSSVSNIASDIETSFRGVSDKMKVVALFFRDHSPKGQMILKDLFNDNTDVVFVGGSEQFKSIDRTFFRSQSYLETYKLKDEFFGSEITQHKSIPWERIQHNGEAIWNATIENGPPLIGFGKSVTEETPAGLPVSQFAVVCYIKADKILTSLTQGRLSQVFVTNQAGEILVHPDAELMVKPTLMPNKIVDLAKEQPVKTSVLQYVDNDEEMLGAFSKSYNQQILVLSSVSGAKAFAVVNRLIYRSLMFAMIVVTIAFIVAILFSRTLTKPIEILVKGMKKVADGDLNTYIRIRSRDEISVLAASFNSMIHDLKDSREKLEEINRNLELKVKERTYELEQQNQAVKKAQEALLRTTRLAAVGEIAGQAAHEVLNPLTSIMSRVQRVRDRLEGRKKEEVDLLAEIYQSWREEYAAGGFEKLESSWQQPSSVLKGATLWDEDLSNFEQIYSSLDKEFSQLKEDAEFLLQEGQRINRIVNSMRSLSAVRGELKKHSIRALISECVKIMADLAAEKGAKMEIVHNIKREEVMIDKDEFVQSMTNIIRNGLQSIYMYNESHPDNPRSGVIKITTSHPANGELMISIADNGLGISEENKKRLFESQFSTKSLEDGTGLGLKISRRFIRAFNGELFLKASSVNEGAEFAIRLPLDKSSAERMTA